MGIKAVGIKAVPGLKTAVIPTKISSIASGYNGGGDKGGGGKGSGDKRLLPIRNTLRNFQNNIINIAIFRFNTAVTTHYSA